MKPESQLPPENLTDLTELVSRAPDGNLIEVGVYKGGSAWAIQQAGRGRILHLFDTFTGIPYADPGDIVQIAHFSDTSAEAVQQAFPKAVIYAGLFPDTFPDSLHNIAFMHVDCDQHRGCAAAIKLWQERGVSGAIIAFDDYSFPGIRKAIDDAKLTVAFTPNKIPYAVKE